MSTRILAATVLAAALSSTPAHAELDVGAGIEHYTWEETLQDSSLRPKEDGFRYALHLKWTESGNSGLLYAYNAKVYSGRVAYDTYTLVGNTPVSVNTDYIGMTHEGQLIFRDRLDNYRLDYVGGLGWDSWRRNINRSQIEDYSVWFLRAGFTLDLPRQAAGFHGGGGLKVPIYTIEDAHLDSLGFSSNPQLSPGKGVSLYAELAYRASKYWDIVGYYDSWRFSQSDPVYVTTRDTTLCGSTQCSIVQPQSGMNAFGLKAMLSF